MRSRIAVFLAALVMMVPVGACGQSAGEQAMQTTTDVSETWQEAYTVIMRAHNDGVGGNFFLLDADGDGTPELYRLMNLRGNEIYISDFARGRTEVYADFSVSEMYFDQAAGTLGVYHRDGGPAGDSPEYAIVMPHFESFGEYRYADGKYTCLILLVHNWATEDVAGNINIPEFEQITMDGKDITLEAYDARAAGFREKYDAHAIYIYSYEEGMDINQCWASAGTTLEMSTAREEASTEKDRASVFSLFGITEKTVPFYEYYNNDGVLQLELFYDTVKEEGVGVYYGTYLYEVSAASFLVGAAEQATWIDHKYLIASEHKSNGVNYFATLPDYKEYSANNKQGKPTMFHATMSAEDGYGGTFTRDLIEITWEYRDDGTLRYKNKVIPDDGYRGSERFYYDSKERLVYVNAYITSGTLEDYYIYQGNSKTPSYRLTLHHDMIKDRFPNTVLLLKQIPEEGGERVKLVLRIHVKNDNPAYKNSILTLWKIDEDRWQTYARSKKIIDKRE